MFDNSMDRPFPEVPEISNRQEAPSGNAVFAGIVKLIVPLCKVLDHYNWAPPSPSEMHDDLDRGDLPADWKEQTTLIWKRPEIQQLIGDMLASFGPPGADYLQVQGVTMSIDQELHFVLLDFFDNNYSHSPSRT